MQYLRCTRVYCLNMNLHKVDKMKNSLLAYKKIQMRDFCNIKDKRAPEILNARVYSKRCFSDQSDCRTDFCKLLFNSLGSD